MRWNLKEAAGKALARRTEIAYEAGKLDEKAHIFKVRYLYGKLGCRCGGHKREGESALPGEVCNFANGLLSSQGGGMKLQKSAEGIVGSFGRAEGPNMK
ncbi:MAG: hypothetical protein LC776_02810 [Acidobacteria bacterium]|nr:hypothetical protein [Acidobacteriota bacterium]